MEPDDTLDGALHGLARHARQTGRLAPVTEVRRRGDIRRRRRQVATAALGVALVGALGAGVTAVRLADAPHGTLPAGPDGRTPGPPPGTPSVTPTPGTSRAPATGGPTGGSGSPRRARRAVRAVPRRVRRAPIRWGWASDSSC